MTLPYYDDIRPGERSVDYIIREVQRIAAEAGPGTPLVYAWNHPGLTYLMPPDFKGEAGRNFMRNSVLSPDQFLRALDDAARQGARGGAYLSPLVAQMAGRATDPELYDWLWTNKYGAPSFPANPPTWAVEYIKAGSKRQADAIAAQTGANAKEVNTALFEQTMNGGAWQNIQSDVIKTTGEAISNTQKATADLLRRPDVQAAQAAQSALNTASATAQKLASDANNALRSAGDIVRYLPYIGIGVGSLILLTVVIPALRRKAGVK